MQRLIVIGVTGVGKSTLAAQIAVRCGLSHVELDEFYWDAHWQAVSPAVFRARVDATTRQQSWVLAGNYGSVRDLVWSRADTLIWLDYPLHRTMVQLLTRTVRRLVRREVLWNGNSERFSDNFFSRRSLFLWALKTHPQMRVQTPGHLNNPAVQHLRVHRFTHPRQTAAWLQALHAPQSPSPSTR